MLGSGDWVIKIYFGELSHVQALHALTQNIEPARSEQSGPYPIHSMNLKEKSRT